eukprot:3444625-Rhodomonas_salina.1
MTLRCCNTLILVYTFNDWEELQKQKMPQGCAGLARPTNMLDVCDLAQIWHYFNPATICRCWIAVGLLNPDQESLLDAVSGGSRRGLRTATLRCYVCYQNKDAYIDELTTLFAKCQVGPKDGEELPDFKGLSEDAILSAMEEWIEMEEDQEVVLIELENEAEAEDDVLEKPKEADEVEYDECRPSGDVEGEQEEKEE